MKLFTYIVVAALGLLVVPLVIAQPKTTAGAVCSGPKSSCDASYKKFAPYELGFRLPKTIKDNTPTHSVNFYAIVVSRRASGQTNDCDGGEWTIETEGQRKRIQALFPDKKVFADHQCPDMGAVNYTVDGKPGFGVMIAVYGGATKAEAKQTLARVKKKFKAASLSQMRVSFERIVQ